METQNYDQNLRLKYLFWSAYMSKNARIFFNRLTHEDKCFCVNLINEAGQNINLLESKIKELYDPRTMNHYNVLSWCIRNIDSDI